MIHVPKNFCTYRTYQSTLSFITKEHGLSPHRRVNLKNLMFQILTHAQSCLLIVMFNNLISSIYHRNYMFNYMILYINYVYWSVLLYVQILFVVFLIFNCERLYRASIVHSHRKTEKVFFLGGATRDFRCVHHVWHSTHRYDTQVLATHASTEVTMVTTYTRIA
jgi:hypothetical protein